MGQVEANTGYFKETSSGGVWVTLSHHKGSSIVGFNVLLAATPPDFGALKVLQDSLVNAAAAVVMGGDIADFRAHVEAMPCVTGSGPWPSGSPAALSAAASDDALRGLANAIYEQIGKPYVMTSAASHGG